MRPTKETVNGRTIMSFCFFLAGLYVIVSAIRWPPRTGLFPLIMGIIFTALFALDLAFTFFSKKWTEEEHGGLDFKLTEGTDKGDTRKKTIEAFGWICGYFFLVLFIGFVYAIPAFFVLYFRFSGKESWKKSIIVAAIGFLVFYLFFVWGMSNAYPDSWLVQILVALGIMH